MRSYVYAALKRSIGEYDGRPGKFTSTMTAIIEFGAQDRGDRPKFVVEAARAAGVLVATVERWCLGKSVPRPSGRKTALQAAFDRILQGRSK
jgi:hypothetical protein